MALRSLLYALAVLAAPQLVAAQTSEDAVTVYLLLDPRYQDTSIIEEVYGSATYTGSVIAANPTATSYSFALPPFSDVGFGSMADLTLVNGPSTYAERLGNSESPFFAQACSMTGTPLVYDCTITNIGIGARGTTSSTYFQTTTTAVSPDMRTFVGIKGVITESYELLDAAPTTIPAAYAAATGTYEGGGRSPSATRTPDLNSSSSISAPSTFSPESATSSESSVSTGSETLQDSAVETGTRNSGAEVKNFSLPLLLAAGAAGGVLIVLR